MASNTNDVTGLTGRYARALFQLAEEQDVLEVLVVTVVVSIASENVTVMLSVIDTEL